MQAKLFRGESVFGTDIDAVCELFAVGQSDATLDFLRQHAETPLQVPFYYLHLLRTGHIQPEQDRPAPLSLEQIELAYRAILQRAPENTAVVHEHRASCDNAQQLIARLLASHEVISRLPVLHAAAFPLHRRLWHVHIPKTAGSSFCSAARASGWGSVNTNELSGAEGKLSLVAQAVHLSLRATTPTIITGHWRLMQYLDGIGPFDRVIVFTRDPVECCISRFNYLVDVCHRRPNVHLGDPQSILAGGFDPENFARNVETGYFAANEQCAYLAHEGICRVALQNLARCQAELLPSSTASAAIARYFPGVSQKPVNISNKHLRSADIDRGLREEICLRNGEDYLLHHVSEARHAERQAAPQSPVLRVVAAAA